MTVTQLEVPYGYCHCGCGEKTTVARWNDRSKGHVAGEPKRWLKGHCNRRLSAPSAGWTIDASTGCWVWDGTTADGYGLVTRLGRRYVAHRLIYEERRGKVPNDMELDHLCRNRRCVNPDHLEVVTRAENARRGATAKLSHGAVAVIRASSAPTSELAAEFKVGPDAILRARKGLTWA